MDLACHLSYSGECSGGLPDGDQGIDGRQGLLLINAADQLVPAKFAGQGTYIVPAGLVPGGIQ
jgi:hypothetical protein